MGDRTRLFITGLVAVAAVGVTVAAPSPWSMVFDNDDHERHVTVPLSSLKDFDGITTHGPDDVVVTHGDHFAVTIEGEPRAANALRLYVKDEVLHVTRKEGHWRDDGATVHVTMPSLRRLRINGSGDTMVEKVDVKEFSALVIGSGDLQVDNVTTDALAVSLRGSGDIAMSGNAKALDVNLFGSGDIRLDQLEAASAQITVRGSGEVEARATGNARLDVTGSGGAHVTGTTRCQISKIGSGDAECTTG